MTPRAPFYIPNQKPTLQALTLQMALPHLQDGVVISEKVYSFKALH